MLGLGPFLNLCPKTQVQSLDLQSLQHLFHRPCLILLQSLTHTLVEPFKVSSVATTPPGGFTKGVFGNGHSEFLEE